MKMRTIGLLIASSLLAITPLASASAHDRDHGRGPGWDRGRGHDRHDYRRGNNGGRDVGIFGLGALTGAFLFSGPRTQVAYYEAPRPVYVQPQPVYYQPAPVYVAPRPVYYRPYY